MTYTSQAAFVAGDKLRAAQLNTLRTNIEHLLTRPWTSYVLNSADYTTTASTFVDVDATNLALTFTPASPQIEVHFHGMVSCPSGGSAHYVYFDLLVNGARIGGDDGIIATMNTNITLRFPISFTRRITVTPNASTTVKLQWKTTAGATATLYAGSGSTPDVHGQFWIAEA